MKILKTFEEFIGDIATDKIRKAAIALQHNHGDKDEDDPEVEQPVIDTGDGDTDPNS